MYKFLSTAFVFCTLVFYSPALFAQLTGTFTDSRDDKTYKTVKIGSQVWMAENLAYNSDVGCRAYNEDPANIEKYGYLYNFSGASKACPNGWHLPSRGEYNLLLFNLGQYGTAGRSMKSSTGWTSGNGTNSSGFCALPGGYYWNVKFGYRYIGKDAYFWSSTEVGKDELVWFLHLSCRDNQPGWLDFGNYCYLSVRCIKDR